MKLKIIFAASLLLAQCVLGQEPLDSNQGAPIPSSDEESLLLGKNAMNRFLNKVASADEIIVLSLTTIYLEKSKDGKITQDLSNTDHSIHFTNHNGIKSLLQILESSEFLSGGVLGCRSDRLTFKYKGKNLAILQICWGKDLESSDLPFSLHMVNPKPFLNWFSKNKIDITLPIRRPNP